MRETELIVEDVVEGAREPAVARFHFHPTIAARLDGQRLTLNLDGVEVARGEVSLGTPRMADSSYSPFFNVEEASSCLEIDLADNESDVRFFLPE